jgi:hypothetical protein
MNFLGFFLRKVGTHLFLRLDFFMVGDAGVLNEMGWLLDPIIPWLKFLMCREHSGCLTFLSHRISLKNSDFPC